MSDNKISKSAFVLVATIAPKVSLSPTAISKVRQQKAGQAGQVMRRSVLVKAVLRLKPSRLQKLLPRLAQLSLHSMQAATVQFLQLPKALQQAVLVSM